MADTPETEPIDEAHGQWFTLLRRAFGIPDLAGPDDARAAILEQLQEHVREAEKIHVVDKPDELEDRTLDAIVKAGAKGSYSVLLAGLPVGEAPAWRDDPKEQTVRGIANSSRWQTEQVLNAVRDLVAFTLQRVNGFVEAHPFQDESGRYFS